MAFKGKTEELSLPEILQLCLSEQRAGSVLISTSEKSFHLTFKSGKITAISSSHPTTDFKQILLNRKWASPKQLETINVPQNADVLQSLVDNSIITSEQAQNVKYHFAEELFFDLLKFDSGEFKFTTDQPDSIFKFDLGFRDWVAETIPDIKELIEVRSVLNDFDIRIFWVTPEKFQNTAEQLSLEDIKVLSRYKPKITVRNYWYALSEQRRAVIKTLIHLFNLKIYTFSPPRRGEKLPDSKPFLRLLLRILINKVESVRTMIGIDGEVVEILRSVADQMSAAPSGLLHTTPIQEDSEDNLTSITSSMEDLLSMESLEDLEITDTDDSTPVVEKQKITQQKEEATQSSKQKAAVSKPGPSETGEFSITGEFEFPGKLQDEAPEIETLEDKVEAKVRYRRFVSNVTMNYNRLHMRNMNYFEMLGIPPNANRKAIHKAFTKIIRKINPRGVRLTDRDKELLERAVWVRDKLKEAYKTLMDPTQRRRYLASLRESREDEERRKSQALVLFNEGMAEFKAENFEKAKEIFMKAIKYDPNSPVYYNMLEEIRKKESSTKATKYFQGAILAFKQKNDPNRAIKLLKKAITLSPKQGIFYQKLAEIQASQPTTRMDAVQSYETALELDPGNMELRLTVANYLLKIGQKQEAANRFQEILKWNADNISARKALMALKKEGIVPKKAVAKARSEEEEEEEE